MKSTQRYFVHESRGGSVNRFYVWDSEKKQMVKGKLNKFSAIGLEHKLNNKKLKSILV
jgi:hypothetical protein